MKKGTYKSIIRLEDVWKIYHLGANELIALKSINLEIAQGDFISIMGASGSGKSTLLNMLGTLDFPSKGKVFLKEKETSLMSQNQLAQLRGKTIGFVFQEFNVLPNLTALENVTLPMIFQKIPLKERETKAKNLLISLGLGERILHRAMELSGGERQRVAIARAFANDPEMVIADEPTGNLDSLTGKKIMDLLVDFHKKEGKTIIIVTHDNDIARYAEKIIRIRDGQIIKSNN